AVSDEPITIAQDRHGFGKSVLDVWNGGEGIGTFHIVQPLVCKRHGDLPAMRREGAALILAAQRIKDTRHGDSVGMVLWQSDRQNRTNPISKFHGSHYTPDPPLRLSFAGPRGKQ